LQSFKAPLGAHTYPMITRQVCPQTKTAHLWHHLKRNGVCVRQSLLIPRVLFLSPDCHLDEELAGKRKELVPHEQLDAFLASFRESYVGWISDAFTPSWFSGERERERTGSLVVNA